MVLGCFCERVVQPLKGSAPQVENHCLKIRRSGVIYQLYFSDWQVEAQGCFILMFRSSLIIQQPLYYSRKGKILVPSKEKNRKFVLSANIYIQ